MGSPITAMLAQAGGGLGVGSQSPELQQYCAANPQDTSLCPPQEAAQPAVDPTAGAEPAALGVPTTPATVIDGEVVTGFDPPKMDRLLGDGAGN